MECHVPDKIKEIMKCYSNRNNILKTREEILKVLKKNFIIIEEEEIEEEEIEEVEIEEEEIEEQENVYKIPK